MSYVIANKVEDFGNIQVLAEVVNSGCRKLFSIITKDELYETVCVHCLILFIVSYLASLNTSLNLQL